MKTPVVQGHRVFPEPAVDKKFVAVNNSVLVETTPQFIVVTQTGTVLLVPPLRFPGGKPGNWGRKDLVLLNHLDKSGCCLNKIVEQHGHRIIYGSSPE